MSALVKQNVCTLHGSVEKTHYNARTSHTQVVDSDNNDTQEQLYEEEELILDGI